MLFRQVKVSPFVKGVCFSDSLPVNISGYFIQHRGLCQKKVHNWAPLKATEGERNMGGDQGAASLG